jgi:hypothetical protein
VQFSRLQNILVMAVLLAWPAMSFAGQTPEPHWNGDAATPLYHLSVFAHGFIHGYEDGFRIGDAVYQLGMAPGDFSSYKQYKEATGHYSSNFGPKDHFKAGYREGFRDGYQDSIANRRFRAVEAARDSASGLSLSPGYAFEVGFENGYHAASSAAAQDAALPCDAETANNQRMLKGGYCEGFARGVRFWQEAVALPGGRQAVVTASRR